MNTAHLATFEQAGRPTPRRELPDWRGVLLQHGQWLWTVVKSRVADPHEAADVYQNVAIGVLSQKGKPHEIASLEPWLYRLAVRQVLMFRRKMGRARRHYETVVDQAEHSERSELSPLDLLMLRESDDFLQNALLEMDERDRDVLVLKYVENWTYEQIASRLGISFNAVEYRLVRAKKYLRHRLEQLHTDVASGKGNELELAEETQATSSEV